MKTHLVSWLLFFIACAHAATVTKFVDDTDSSIKYSTGFSQGNTCEECLITRSGLLDTTQTYRGTWHDGTSADNCVNALNITIPFTGDSITAYFIIANYVEYTTTDVSVLFTLDGVQVGRYKHIPNTSSDFSYHVPVFASQPLKCGKHTLVISSDGSAGLILFDYYTYTTPKVESSTKPTSTQKPTLSQKPTSTATSSFRSYA